LALALCGLVVVGCGGSSHKSSSGSVTPTPRTPTPSTPSGGGSSSSGGGGQTLNLSADPSGALKFNTSSLTAKAGKVTIIMGNNSPLPHGIAVTGNGVNSVGPTVTGGTSKVTVTLKPGTYTFYCPVPGHRQAGMQGTLKVT
jgi:uncharacterized cupredoxin-like copper-binding protein